jgi:hypothetical protein
MKKKLSRLCLLLSLLASSSVYAQALFCTTSTSTPRVCNDAENAAFERDGVRPSRRQCSDNAKSSVRLNVDIGAKTAALDKDSLSACEQMQFDDASFNAVYSNTCRLYKSKIYAPELTAFVSKTDAPRRSEINVDWRREKKSDFTSTPQWMIPPGESLVSTLIKFEKFGAPRQDKAVGKVEVYQLKFTGEKEPDHVLAMEYLEDKSVLLNSAGGVCFAAADENHAKNLEAQAEKAAKQEAAKEAKEKALQEKFADAPSCDDVIKKQPKNKQMITFSNIASGNPPEPCKKCGGMPGSACQILIPAKMR